jgi:hypothetical protein
MIAVAAAMLLASPAHAALFVVDAKNNSSSGGIGLGTIGITAGETLTVNVNPTDLWNAGALPRWSNANGLTGNLLATGTDDSGALAGTLIGTNFGLYTQSGLSAPYGALVGEIGGTYKLLGTSYSGLAWGSGTLRLYYWDSNNGDNTQFVTADVSKVPEPATLGVVATILSMLTGILLMRRRKAARI